MRKKTIFIMLFPGLLAWSCLKEKPNGPNVGPTDPAVAGSFDYAMTSVCALDLNYDLRGYAPSSKIPFEVYAENPYSSARQGLKPVFSAVTDADGKFSGKMLIPDHLTKVWIKGSALGAPDLLELAVDGGKISFDVTAPVAVSRAGGVAGKYRWPDNMKVLYSQRVSSGGSVGYKAWNSSGEPLYLTERGEVPEGLLNEISAVFADGKNFPERHPSLMNGQNREIEVLKDAEVNMYFLHESCDYRNTLGYYTYPKGQKPVSPQDIDNLTIAYPNASLAFSSGVLGSGYNVQLKYWNGTEFVETFPAGTMIALFMIPNGYDLNTESVVLDDAHPLFLSDYDLAGHAQQVVAYRSTAYQANILAFEDTDRNGGGSDEDFNDMFLYVQSTPLDGTTVPGPTDPDPDPEPEPETSYVVSGTLIFEDLWPYRGDYDINDIVIEYTSTVWQNRDNKVIRTEDVFRPVHMGAALQSGFAFQYNVPTAQVTAMELAVEGGQQGGGNNYVPIPFEKDALGFETGQTNATVMLFDDIRAAVNPGAEYTLRTSFEPQDPATFGFPPYNPFVVIVHGTVAAGTERDRELHLPTRAASQVKYLPTAKANMKWFGYGDDLSAPAEGLYYVSKDNYPWAINVPTHGFSLAPEMGKIYDKYPGFAAWASSNGTENEDWYLHPTE